MLISLFSLATAGPLADVARIELTNTRELHRAIRTAELSTRYKVSPACTTAHADASTSIEAARTAFDAGSHDKAYAQIHATLLTLKPCALELARGPRPYQTKIKVLLRSSDEQLEALDAHLKVKGNEASKKAFGDAVAAKTTARSKGLADEVEAATKDWYTMLEAIEAAIKAST